MRLLEIIRLIKPSNKHTSKGSNTLLDLELRNSNLKEWGEEENTTEWKDPVSMPRKNVVICRNARLKLKL